MQSSKTYIFIKLGILCLIIVALVGTLMRYKMSFEFPFFNQNYLLHAHSHFAFSGWVTHMLFTLLVYFIKDKLSRPKLFNGLIITNLVIALGMLISFTIQGYGAVSIVFSTLSIFVGYVFAYFYVKELRKLEDHPSHNWFKASLLFNVFSSIGTFYLAYMMASKNMNQDATLASIYFYLHFQYSGWFFFAIMGLIISKLKELPSFVYDASMFKLFFAACFPAYFFSVLWLKLPWYFMVLPVFAVILQFYGLFFLIRMVRENWIGIKTRWHFIVKWLIGLAFIALIIKFSLQAGSIFPEISKLAFGIRSIVIAYLHLVLLAFTTLFLLGYMVLEGHITVTKNTKLALILFSIGVFANEFVLLVQGGVLSGYFLIPYLNEILLSISAFMLLSLLILLVSNKKNVE